MSDKVSSSKTVNQSLMSLKRSFQIFVDSRCTHFKYSGMYEFNLPRIGYAYMHQCTTTNDLSFTRCHAITWTDDSLLQTGAPATNFKRIEIKYSKISHENASATSQPFYLDLHVVC